MNQNLSLLVISVVIFSIAGFYVTKDAYKPGSNDYRGKILGPSAILGALAAFYKALEVYFEW